MLVLTKVVEDGQKETLVGELTHAIDLRSEVVDGLLGEGLVHQLVLHQLRLHLRQAVDRVLQLLNGLREELLLIAGVHHLPGEVDGSAESQSQRQLPQRFPIEEVVHAASRHDDGVLLHVLLEVLQRDSDLGFECVCLCTSLAH